MSTGPKGEKRPRADTVANAAKVAKEDRERERERERERVRRLLARSERTARREGHADGPKKEQSGLTR